MSGRCHSLTVYSLGSLTDVKEQFRVAHTFNMNYGVLPLQLSRNVQGNSFCQSKYCYNE